MATSPRPATSPVERDDNNLTPKEFGEKLDALAKHHNNLMKLASKVYALGKTQRLQYPNGSQVGRKELRTLSSQFVKELKSCKKNYTAHGKRSKRVRRAGGSAGFKNPIKVTENMQRFLAEANLGPSGVIYKDEVNKKGELVRVPFDLDPASAPLNTLLAAGQAGVTTRAIMTPLFNIYVATNAMQKDPVNRQFLTATPQMNQYFQPTYARLAAKPQKYQKNKATGGEDLSKPLPKFDPNHFRFASIQSIVADNTVPAATLSAEEQAYLANPAVVARLAEEQQIVSDVLKVYKKRKTDAAKAAKRK